MKGFVKFSSMLMLLFLFGCSGGGSAGNATFTMSLSSSSVVAGGSVSSTAKLTATTSSPVNNIDINFTSNRPDLIHFATNTATNSGASSITVKSNSTGSAYVILNIDNSVAIPVEGVDVSITTTSSGLTSTQQLKVTALSTGGTTVGTTKISLALGATSIQDNSGQTIATATVTDSAGSALSGQTVAFTISPATGPATIVLINGGVTDSSGKAFATISGTTTSTTQNIFIYAAVSGVSAAQPLSIVPTVTPPIPTSIPKNIALTLGSSSLLASEQTILTSTVTDSNNAPVAFQTVSFSVLPAGSHVIVTPINGGVTDSTGKAYASVTATNATTVENVFLYITTGIAPNVVTSSTVLKVLPSSPTPTFQNITLSIGKNSLQSSEQTIITTTVTDANNSPVANQAVAFNIQPTGTHATATLINSGLTDSTGKAYAIITATIASSIENVLVYASTGVSPNIVSGSLQMQILPPAAIPITPTSAKVSMNPDKTSIQPNGQALIDTTIIDSAGAVVPNEVVTFSIISGPLSLTTPASATTGSDGKVMAVVQANATINPTYALIKATTANGTSQTISIAIAPSGKPQLTLSIAKQTIEATDREVLATVQVLDSNGDPVNGQSVSFSKISGPFTVDPTLLTVTTGADGKATTKLTPTATAFASNMLLSMQLTYQGTTYSLVATALVNPAVKLTVAVDSAAVDTVGQVIATTTATTASGTPLPGQVVTFSIIGPGIIVGQSTTTAADGTSKAVITHDLTSNIGNIIVEASITYGGTTYNAYATVIPKAANMKLDLFVQSGFTPSYSIGGALGSFNDATTTTVDGLTAGLPIKAKFTYLDGTPVPNQTVSFTALDPGLFWNSAGATAANGSTVTATTTTSGEAYAVAIPGNFNTSGFIHIQASVVINGTTYTQVMPIAVQPTQVQKTLTLDKASLVISPNVMGTVSGVYNLKDINGSPLVAKSVTFSILSGPATITVPATVNTDGAGNAQVFIQTSPTVTARETVYVNAAVTVSGVTFNTVSSFTVDPSIKLALVTDIAKVDSSGGHVVATATLTDSAGTAISGQNVTFSILAPVLATITSAPTVVSSTNGIAKATIQTTATDSTQNVLVQASTTYAGTTYTQVTAFQITKGIGTLVVTAPATTSSTAKAPATVSWITAIPIQLLDANGNPRTNVPITLSVISSDRAGYRVATGVGTYAATATLNTDAQGKVIFSTQSASLTVAAVDSFDTTQVVWRAQTNDASPIIGYATSTYSLTGS